MKLTVLVENTCTRPGLAGEHGLSLYLETRGHRVLFDAGTTDLFEQNARALGVALEQVVVADDVIEIALPQGETFQEFGQAPVDIVHIHDEHLGQQGAQDGQHQPVHQQPQPQKDPEPPGAEPAGRRGRKVEQHPHAPGEGQACRQSRGAVILPVDHRGYQDCQQDAPQQQAEKPIHRPFHTISPLAREP